MFGLFLRRFRKSRHLTQGEVASVMGVDHVYICRVEKGSLRASENFYKKFVEYYGDMFTDEEKADLDFVKIESPVTMRNDFLDNFCRSRNISGADLAKSLSYNNGYISNLRTGKLKISPMFAKKFYEVYGDILTDEEKLELKNTVDNPQPIVMKSNFINDFCYSRGVNANILARTLSYSKAYMINIRTGNVKISPVFANKFLEAYGALLSEEEKEQLLEEANSNKTVVTNLEINKPLFFAEWIANFRITREKTQTDMAMELNTSYTNISNIERGISQASFSFLERFMDAYEMDLTAEEKEQLFMYFEKQSPEYTGRILLNFIRKNGLTSDLLKISSLSLEREETKKIFDEAVEKAKEVSLKKGKKR